MGALTDITKQAFSAFMSGNIPALLEMLADDVEWRFLASQETGTPYGGTYNGRQQVAGFFAKLAETTEILEFEPREFLEGQGPSGWQDSRHRVGGSLHHGQQL